MTESADICPLSPLLGENALVNKILAAVRADQEKKRFTSNLRDFVLLSFSSLSFSIRQTRERGQTDFNSQVRRLGPEYPLRMRAIKVG